MENLLLRVFGVIPNTDLESGIKICKELFDRAKSSIRIVAGNLDSRFYNNSQIVQALEKASERGVLIEIIHGPQIDPASKEILRLKSEKKVKLYRYKKRPADQFMVIDRKHVRVEEFHHSEQDERRAYVKYNTIFLGQRLEIEFAELMQEIMEKEE